MSLLATAGLVLMGAACGGPSGPVGGPTASCVGPYLDDQPPGGPFRGAVPTVSPGATITIHGHWYTRACHDTGGRDEPRPLPPVSLTLTLPGGQVQELGEAYPRGPDLGFSVLVRVPPTSEAGTASVRDDRRGSVPFTFRVARQP